MRNPRILVLDEATANVDTQTEMLVEQAISAVLSNRTSIAVAHRLSTIRRADRILVMDQGRIVEEGRTKLLNAVGGFTATSSAPKRRAVLPAVVAVVGRCCPGSLIHAPMTATTKPFQQVSFLTSAVFLRRSDGRAKGIKAAGRPAAPPAPAVELHALAGTPATR